MARNDILDTISLDGPTGREAEKAVSSTRALARYCLEATLTRAERRALKSHAKVVIIETFDDESVEMIHDYLRHMTNAPRIVTVSEARRFGREKSGGADSLGILEDGMSVLFITRDAGAKLATEVLAAADHHIVLSRPGLKTVRRTIRAVTGSLARGLVEADILGLTTLDILSAIRPNISGAQCVDNLRRAARFRRAPHALGSVRPLEELALTRVVRAWADQTLETMASVCGTASGSTLRFGLLQGPPGTGKTTIAAGLARSAGWDFVSDSVAGWFATSDGNLGGVVKAAARFFDALKSAPGPIVGFLDELDALPNRAALDARDSQWWAPVITHVLLQIDMLRKSGRPILLISATNHFEKLDGALIRAGRLEKHVPVFPPDAEERAEIFEAMLKGEIERSEAEILARLTPGATPALIESHVDAARSAKKGRLGLADLMAVVAPPSGSSPKKQLALALHEAGHAVVAMDLGVKVDEISLLSRGMIGGTVTTSPGERLMTRQDVETFVTISLGGRAADMVLGSGPNAGAVSDLRAANEMLEEAVNTYGLYGSLRSGKSRGGKAQQLEEVITNELETRLAASVEIVQRRRSDVERLARILVQERVMSGSRLTELFGANAVEPQHADEHLQNGEAGDDGRGNRNG